jgi:hypothetical protein
MFRTELATAAFAEAVAIAPAQAQERVPAALDNLKPHEVVEAIRSEATSLKLAPDDRRRDHRRTGADPVGQWDGSERHEAHCGANGRGASSRGMVSSTVLTLLVIPPVYLIWGGSRVSQWAVLAAGRSALGQQSAERQGRFSGLDKSCWFRLNLPLPAKRLSYWARALSSSAQFWIRTSSVSAEGATLRIMTKRLSSGATS